MLHKCIGSMSYKEQYWEHFACSVSKKESKEKVADMLMPEIIGYKVREQVHNQETYLARLRVLLSSHANGK